MFLDCEIEGLTSQCGGFKLRVRCFLLLRLRVLILGTAGCLFACSFTTEINVQLVFKRKIKRIEGLILKSSLLWVIEVFWESFKVG